MKDAKGTLLDYLASFRDPEKAASLFAEDGVLELPYLSSLGVEPRYVGREQIAAVVEDGRITLLREAFNVLAAAQALLPGGAADVPAPGDEIHSY
ncbi:MAG TPA: hypothetical protein VK611_05350 [Acidimicrobiales bacterium]|nr:hypothetical protein [Acidimicrobiales bacterium]